MVAFVQLVAIVGAICIASLGGLGAAYFVYWPAGLDKDNPSCSAAWLTPYPADKPRDAHVFFQVNSTDDEFVATLCIYSADARKRYQEEFTIFPGESLSRSVDFPAETVLVVMNADHGTMAGRTSGFFDLAACPERRLAAHVTFDFWENDPTRYGKMGGGVAPRFSDCGPAPAFEQRAAQGPAAPMQGPKGGGGWVLAGGFAIAGLALAVRWRGTTAVVAGLFSRLLRSSVLDQQVRARIHDLIASEPGIHPLEMGRRLEIGHGQTLHHLRVLHREGLLDRLRLRGRAHYFLAARYAPAQARALAELRAPHAKKIFMQVVGAPDESATRVSENSGISLSGLQRIARRLVEAGLIQRSKQGRVVRLRPGPLASIMGSGP